MGCLPICLLALLPLWLIRGLNRQFSLLQVLLETVISWGSFFTTALAVNRDIDTTSGRYAALKELSGGIITAPKVGPSFLSLVETISPMTLLVWIPIFLGSLSAWRYFKWRHREVSFTSLVASKSAGYAAILLSLILVFIGCEFAHEDTVSAVSFRWSKWREVKQEMSEQDVIQILGEPFLNSLNPPFVKSYRTRPTNPSCDITAKVWVQNASCGWFAVAWFECGKLVDKKDWFSS